MPRSSFVDEVGDSWEEYNVFHHNFLTWLKVNGMDPEEVKRFSDEDVAELVKRSPYHKATSNDVDWMQKVKMQGAIQKWVDHSISVTINLPFRRQRRNWLGSFTYMPGKTAARGPPYTGTVPGRVYWWQLTRRKKKFRISH